MTNGTIVPKEKAGINAKRLQELVEQWESSYKKGLLTFWLLLMLARRPMYAYEIGAELIKISRGTLSADERSIYRALKRFEDLQIVQGIWQGSEIGPRRRYYQLTSIGRELLRRFVIRNILLFQEPEIRDQLVELAQEDKG